MVLADTQATNSHGHHTLAKIALVKLRSLLESENIDVGELELTYLIREVEEAIEEGLQRFPDAPYLLEAEAQLGQLMTDDERSAKALRKAFETNPQNAFITIRLAKLLIDVGELDSATEVYNRALSSGSVDKRVHFNYAKLLLGQESVNGEGVEYHLRRAFTEGDRNTEAQFWHARQLYVNGKVDEARQQFLKLRELALDPALKRRIRGNIQEDGSNKVFTGRIIKLEASYGILARDGTGDRVFVHISNVNEDTWPLLSTNTRLRFRLGFTFSGPTAFDVMPE